jgi:hypothetical protein
MWNFVWADKVLFIRQNKVPHTKVQYLPIYREAKSPNLLMNNGLELLLAVA